MSPIEPVAAASAVKKLALAWGGYTLAGVLGKLGLHSWQDFAGMTASILTCLMIADWCWKKWKARQPKRRSRHVTK
jgi:hypothetical protein